jgi:predicted RNA binding protein YcfA (HicA-like mRNA interferase family)
MNPDPVFNTLGKGKQIIIKFGLNEIAVWLTFPQPVGRLVSSPDLSAALGYSVNNVTVLLGGKVSDFETLIGSEDAKVVLRTTGNRKAALTASQLCRKLEKLADCVFIGHGGNHAMMRAKNGNKFWVPRHDDDLGYGLLAKIIKQAGVNMSVSQFQNAKRREDITFSI